MSFWEKLRSKLKREKKISQVLKEKNEQSHVSIFGKRKQFDKGLNKSASKLAWFFGSIAKKHVEIDEKLFEDLLDMLIGFDVGYAASEQVINACKQEVKARNVTSFDEIQQILLGKLFAFYIHDSDINIDLNFVPGQTNVFLIVGVNGVGKTSAIAKIAHKFIQDKKKVLLVAGDTFRAAACEQLEQWAKRLNCDIVLPKFANQDCASVVYTGVEKGIKEHYDLVICDTSGRQQNKKNLMNELAKIKNIIARSIENGPQETLLVIDATTGQSGLKQATAFKESTHITGIILTKMDSTSKGGIIFAIKESLNVPVKLVSFGETLTDIAEFDLEEYVSGLVKFMESSSQNKLKDGE